MRRLTLPAIALLLIAGIPRLVSAQAGPAQNSISAAVGAVLFDADETRVTAGVSGRAAAALTSRLALEANVLRAKPDRLFGDPEIWVFEGHLQRFWQAGRVRPYAGGGAGIYLNKGEFLTDRSLTVSGAAGLRIDFSQRVAALGEFRIRTVDFAGSLVEIMGGVTIRIGG